MQFFFRNCTHILTRTQGKKFEDVSRQNSKSGNLLKDGLVQHVSPS